MARIKVDYTEATQKKLDIFRELRILMNEGVSVLVITEAKKELHEVFDKYYQYFNIFINRGTLIYKSHSELTEDDFDMVMYEL